MHDSKIILTLGSTFNEKKMFILDKFLLNGVNYVRFNLGKFTNIKDLTTRIEFIRKIKNQYNNDLKIMLDIPYPGRKARIQVNSDYIQYDKAEPVFLTSDKSVFFKNPKSIYVDIDYIGKKLHKSETIIYSDGSIFFHIDSILNDHTLVIYPMNSCTIYNRKSFSFNYIEKEFHLEQQYVSQINSIIPQSIALSFISSASEVLHFRKIFPGVEIVGKIETSEGIENIESIAPICNIMLGRGDLCIHADPYNLFNYQKKVAEICKKRKSQLYICTGILSSLVRRSIPTQSDIIDLSNIFLLDPAYIVLNYPVIELGQSSILPIFNKIRSAVINGI